MIGRVEHLHLNDLGDGISRISCALCGEFRSYDALVIGSDWVRGECCDFADDHRHGVADDLLSSIGDICRAIPSHGRGVVLP